MTMSRALREFARHRAEAAAWHESADEVYFCPELVGEFELFERLAATEEQQAEALLPRIVERSVCEPAEVRRILR